MQLNSKVVVTGASGVLGSAVYNTFKVAGADVKGLAHSRPSSYLKKLDLCDHAATDQFLRDLEPNWVVHCAAERRPDVAEKNPDGARKLNAEVPKHLAELSRALGFTLIYISTDYVFDGTSPPYVPSSATNPLNFYGVTKLDGERAVLVEGANSIVLRVPVLYGPAPNNSDSAVNILLDIVRDKSGKTYKMDDYATRYPTNVLDIARFLVRLTRLSRPIPSILHYSASEPFTKYQMCKIFGKLIGLPAIQHIAADASVPDAATPRPKDCRLDTKVTEELMSESGGLGTTGFEEWWKSQLLKE